MDANRVAWIALNQLQLNNDLLILQLQITLDNNREDNYSLHEQALTRLIARREKIVNVPISVPESPITDFVWRHPEP
jgi:hypothetical protein